MKRPQSDAGDAWLWLATDADTKLVPCWHVGTRDGDAAMEFIDDLASRLVNRPQVTTDGHRAYLYAFGGEVDYAQLVKLYGASPESAKGRYSPTECAGIVKTRVIGDPDMKHVSTSYAEAGVTDRLWDVADMVEILEAWEATQ
jgi:hypothetical protein